MENGAMENGAMENGAELGNHAPATGASRHVPAALKRAVWERDQGRCTYVDARGCRCPETGGLEIHHEEPFAKGGATTLDNLALRCRPHNDLAAERDFGRELMERKQRKAR
jgi:5-methylcytosine-specific restriction endonuclease McrA